MGKKVARESLLPSVQEDAGAETEHDTVELGGIGSRPPSRPSKAFSRGSVDNQVGAIQCIKGPCTMLRILLCNRLKVNQYESFLAFRNDFGINLHLACVLDRILKEIYIQYISTVVFVIEMMGFMCYCALSCG